MKFTQEQEIEQACTKFSNEVARATLEILKTHDLTEEEKKAFGTGVMCVMDGIKVMLLPTLQQIVKENRKSFENLN
jgi:hypothetical protein